jgi:NhaP-type Na+/H+ or K+/H+ antiporter
LENTLLSLASIAIIGVAAQWLAWRFGLPSILLMLLFGFIAGPVSGLINPDKLFGDLLFPMVSLSVAVVLFEGGLSLRLDELRPVQKVVFNLMTIGASVTWLLSAIAAFLIFDMEYQLALLFGAILVVSGPTVIIPLLMQVRPLGQVGSVIKWEGIVNDPVGAVLAVLVLEAIKAGNVQEAQNVVLSALMSTLLVGTAFGLLGAVVIILLLRYYWVPDYLQNPVTLMIVLGSFAASDMYQEESGLLTVTVMGIILANQPYVSIRHIVEFKENLRVLLISSLFIVLAARLHISDFTDIGFNSILFILVLILVIRPLAVALSTLGSDLSRNERLFLSWMAPRGIVAASVASIFALELEHFGYKDAGQIAPLTFLVIISTVMVYGLTAVPVGRWLKVAQPNPQGALIAGAHPWARALAKTLQTEGYRVLLIDINRDNIDCATDEGIPAMQANIVAGHTIDKIELVGVGRLLALTPNDEVNSLATLHFAELFSRAEVYQLSPRIEGNAGPISQPLHGRLLFKRGMTYNKLNDRFESGAVIEKIELTKDFTYAKFQSFYDIEPIPLFLIDEAKNLAIFTTDNNALLPEQGDTVIALVNPMVDVLNLSDTTPESIPV